MWHSTIFGPYFVIGAIHSGIAAILVAMVVLRRVYHLEGYFKDVHFDYLGRMLLVLSLLWFYFTFAEHLTVFYGAEPAEMRTFWAKVTGPYALSFWMMTLGCFVVPFALMARRATRTPNGTLIAGIAVVIGMWLERYNIVVPTSVNPIWEIESIGYYLPSWIELSIMTGACAGFIVLEQQPRLRPPSGRDMTFTSLSVASRRLTTLRVIVICSVAWASASHALSAQSFTGDPTAGRRIFVERGCDDCHSIWGNGGTLGPDFALVGAGRSLQQLAGLFWNHTPRMIETVRQRAFDWPSFTEEDLADIISYIYYVKLFDEPGDADQGERWFREKRCAECHAVGGAGGTSGPRLDSFARYVAPIILAQRMWNRGPAMQAAQIAQGIPMPIFVGRELADIQAYIRRASNLREREPVFLQPPDPNAGRRMFAVKGCVSCHGAGGRGTELGPDLRAATLTMQVSEIAGVLWNHSFQMATAATRARGIEFPQFQRAEMADVIAFLYYLRFYETGGSRRAGERVFSEKGCAACHSGAGEGAIAANLSESDAALTPLGLATAMWNHAPAMYDQLQVANTEWPSFEGNEMRDLSVYLRGIASSGSQNP
jgi:cytochrome c